MRKYKGAGIALCQYSCRLVRWQKEISNKFQELGVEEDTSDFESDCTSVSKETGVAVVTINNLLTNPIESMFATVRLRHRSTKGNGSSKTTLTMVFKICKEAKKTGEGSNDLRNTDLSNSL